MSAIMLEPQTGWQDYELLDSGAGEKLERFGEFVVVRPDPQIIWQRSLADSEWQKADAVFKRTYQDKGQWQFKRQLPPEWPMHWQGPGSPLTAVVKLSPFKHTGVFPEQSAHWRWMQDLLAVGAKDDAPRILNLFAYTGLASMVCAQSGAKVTHVDASRSAIGWAKQNQAASGLDEQSIRWILDDVVKFVSREVKRGVRYHGIIMDPPVYGHGPNGERWEFKESLPLLMDLCKQVLVDQPLFFLINAYAVSTSALTLGNILSETLVNFTGQVQTGELVLEQKNAGRLLSTGIWARWSSNS